LGVDEAVSQPQPRLDQRFERVRVGRVVHIADDDVAAVRASPGLDNLSDLVSLLFPAPRLGGGGSHWILLCRIDELAREVIVVERE
jgi:hypothetical protein